MNDPLWITADGRMMYAGEMETSHLVNCIMKIKRSRKGWRREYLPRLELELELRNLNIRTKV